jgi:hypothetical protein
MSSQQVPRVGQMTAQQSAEEAAARREWQRANKQFLDDRAKYQFGTKESKEAWKRRIQRTRSF